MSQLNGSTVLDSLHINPSIVNSQPRVVISGAGPVGLFTALKLVQAGVHVDVLEKDTKVNESPRAAGYYAGAMAALLKSGIVPSMVELGHVENGLAWMKPPIADGAGGKKHGDKVAFIPFPEATREHPEKGMLILPQSKFTRLLLDIVAKQELAKVHFGQELCAIHEEGEQVIATTNDVMTGEKRTFVASFLVGADGGSSPTRKILGIGLHGHTWPTRLVATDVKKKNHILSEYAARFIIHPTHFAAIIPLEEPIQGQESLWRYAIALDAKDVRSDEEVLSETGIRDLYETVMAGPRPLEYEVQRKAVYRAHQRLAQTMRRGRCLLAGDAAHLNAVRVFLFIHSSYLPIFVIFTRIMLTMTTAIWCHGSLIRDLRC